MTMTRSQKEETSRRSCEMKISPMPRSATSLSRMREHVELHRHVERRGRLVGDQQLGPGDQHHGDHRALAHAARDLVRMRSKTRSGIADLHRLQHGERPVARFAPCRPSHACAASRRSGGRCSSPGSSEYFGSCRIMAMRLPRSVAALPGRRRQQVDAVEGQASSPTPRRCGGVSPMMARPVCDLPEPHFADDAEPLAAEREGDAAHRLDQRRCGSESDTLRSSTVSSGFIGRPPADRARRAGRRRAG